MTATFEAGKTYTTRPSGDASQSIAITVARRTAKTLVTADGVRLNISFFEGTECVYPDGRYSMCPVIFADRWAEAREGLGASPVEAFVILNGGMQRRSPDEYATRAAAQAALKALCKAQRAALSAFKIMPAGEWKTLCCLR